MTRSITPKLFRLTLCAGIVLWMGLVAGRPELIAVAAPMALAAAIGLAASNEPQIIVDCKVNTDRCLEGDVIEATVTVTADDAVRDLRMALAVPAGFTDVEHLADQTIGLPSSGSRTFTIPLRATRWGVHRVGVIGVRAFGPGRLVAWEAVRDRGSPVKVFPYLERVRHAARPPDTQVTAGQHVARVSGDGIEFSRVRPFEAGDKIRSVNWRVTTRRDQLHVNVFHPERNADVVIYLDTFGDFGGDGNASLETSVRGAAGVAQHYLRQRDRVGLVAFGGEVRWLTASMGRTQIYRIVDVLLEARALFSYAWKDIDYLPRRTLPPSALVIAFSPLIDARSIAALGDLAGRGIPLILIDTLAENSVTPDSSREGALAFRVWRLHRAALRSEFATLGVPVVRWSERDGLDAVLASVPRLTKVRVR